MRLSRSSALVEVLVALAVLAFTIVGHAADGSIAGTVKVNGLSSNADAVVYIQQAPGTFAPPSDPALVDQKGYQFIPRVLPVVIGTTVRFLNNDPTRHNVFSPDYEKYRLGTWGRGQSRDHVYDKCSKFPCAYTQLCLLHPEMYAYVVVLQNPFFSVTNADGAFMIEDVPQGDYTLAVWHARAKAPSQRVKVTPGTPVTVSFTLNR